MLTRMLTAATTTALALAAIATPAPAQDHWDTPTTTATAGVPVWGPLTLEFEIREITFFPGEATAFTIPGGTDNTYSDLFDTGIGFGLQVALPFFMQDTEDPTVDVTVGPLIGFDRVTMPGADFDNPGGGSTFSPDDWNITTVYVGGQMRLKTGDILSPVRFLVGVELTLGTVFYEDVESDLSFASGATTLTGPMYDASSGIAFRALVSLGAAIRLNDQFDLNVLVFGGIAHQDVPEDNSDASNPFIPADPDPFVPLVLGFSISLRMRTGG